MEAQREMSWKCCLECGKFVVQSEEGYPCTKISALQIDEEQEMNRYLRKSARTVKCIKFLFEMILFRGKTEWAKVIFRISMQLTPGRTLSHVHVPAILFHHARSVTKHTTTHTQTTCQCLWFLFHSVIQHFDVAMELEKHSLVYLLKFHVLQNITYSHYPSCLKHKNLNCISVDWRFCCRPIK